MRIRSTFAAMALAAAGVAAPVAATPATAAPTTAVASQAASLAAPTATTARRRYTVKVNRTYVTVRPGRLAIFNAYVPYAGAKIKLQVKTARGWKTTRSLVLPQGQAGGVSAQIREYRAGRHHYRIRVISPTADGTSPVLTVRVR